MKKILLIAAALGVMLFTSCESKDMPWEDPQEKLQKEPEEKPEEKLTSLEGTYWKSTVRADGFVYVFEMVFTASIATYTYTDTETETGTVMDTGTFSGRYVFDADKQEFVMPADDPQPYPLEEGFGIPETRGTIEDDVLTVLIPMSLDMYRYEKLKKQQSRP